MKEEPREVRVAKRIIKSAIRKTLASPLLARAAAALSAGRRKNIPADSDPVRLPRDEGAHRCWLEWWYWTGHLRAGAGRRFGFELVFFEVRLAGVTFKATHHAVTDIEKKSFHHRVEWGIKSKEDAGPGIRLSHDDLRAEGKDGNDRLRGEVDGYRLDLSLTSRKAPVLQHDRGYLAYEFGGFAHYYSRQRMDARGTLHLAGEEIPVAGSAWFDHQWGDMGWVFDRSWDWFGIQLDDDREIMVFCMRVGGEERLRGGSLTTAAGEVIRLDPGEIGITPRGTWTSPHTGFVYPRQWLLRVKDEQLLLSPVLEDQELWESIPVYWEGAADVSGSSTGMAYVELNNYGS